jgi:protein TonB
MPVSNQSNHWRLVGFLLFSLSLHLAGVWVFDAELPISRGREVALAASPRGTIEIALRTPDPNKGSKHDVAVNEPLPETVSPRPNTQAPLIPLELDADRYFRMSELDVRPLIRQQIEPEFPLTVDPGTSGNVVVRLFIDQEGRVVDVIAERAEPMGIFEDAAISAFRAATFVPGVRGGKPVKSQLALSVVFESRSLRE